jgi:serine/threonine-protein kinase
VQLVTSNAATARFRADCVVPDLIGLRLGAARSRLQAAHCSLGTVKSVFSTRVAKGRVVSQRPHAHKVRRRGAKVNLDVSRG